MRRSDHLAALSAAGHRTIEHSLRIAATGGIVATMLLSTSGCSSESTAPQMASNEFAPMAMRPMPAGDRKGRATRGGQDELEGEAPPYPSIDLTDGTVPQFNVCHPTIIDTTAWNPQIIEREPFTGEPQSTGSFRPKKSNKPTVPQGPDNDLVAVKDTIDEPRADVQSAFPGIDATGWNPPDPSLAVGPNHVLETVNMTIAWYTKDGTQQFEQILSNAGDPGFFEELGSGGFTFDPKCFYDHTIDRFLVVALEVYNDDEAWITFAISDDDDPNGIWYKYRTWAVVGVGNTDYWVDYPGYGYDEQGFYVTGNLFRLAGQGPGFGGVLFRSFDKTALLDGGPVSFTDVRDGIGASVQATQSFGDAPSPYFVSRGSSSQIKIQTLLDPVTFPVLMTTYIDVPQHSAPGGAPNLGGGEISALDGRLMNVHWRDGNLYACHGIAGDNGAATARWYHFATNGWPYENSVTLEQVGEIDAGVDVHTFFPAIYSNKYGDVGLVVAQSSANQYASVQVTGREAGDLPGTMGPLELLSIGNQGTSGRWGDYFDIAIDPSDDTTFWVVGETFANGGWRTWLGDFVITEPSCSADIDGSPGVGVDDLLMLLSNWGTGGAGSDIAAPLDTVDVADLLGMLAEWGDC